MKEFVFTYPTKVYFGEGSLEKAVAAECGKYGKTVMLAYGGANQCGDRAVYRTETDERGRNGCPYFHAVFPDMRFFFCGKAFRR